ncbi:hypothetical protein [Cyanobium sp. NIES-981]|uniref:hypothetical protein n=1 Tax=Cyanobium sp. NIES-981 TaxID=1851505 RepID=UPI0012FABC3E|nr:hypothetical protein [Cyanobium sp. NIES-981]
MGHATRAYRRRHGCYLNIICTEQIYRRPPNPLSCQPHVIRFSGPRLGRLRNDPESVAAVQGLFTDEHREHYPGEGESGQAKRRYRSGLICVKLPLTQGLSIASNVLVMNRQNQLEVLCVVSAVWIPLLDPNIDAQHATKGFLIYHLSGIG